MAGYAAKPAERFAVDIINLSGKRKGDRMSITDKFSGVSKDAWLSLLQRSVREPYIEGVEFPRFPHSSIQMGYNGAVDEESMSRAHAFWEYAEEYSHATGRPLGKDSRVLDIGCGWGRITRTFARDVPAENLYGVDIDPNAITLCRYLGVPGQFTLTEPGARLPFPDGYFNVIVALSVFTHLPEAVATNLIAEMHRVAAPGCIFVFTVEDDSFLDNFEIPGIENHGERWRLLSKYKPHLSSLRASFAAGEYMYLTTVDEEIRTAEVYGDAVVPKAWIEKAWSKYFRLVTLIPSAPPLYQAVVVGIRD